MRFRVIASACVVVLLGGGWALAQTTDLSNGVFIAHAPASLQYTNSPPTGTWCGAYAQYAAIDSCSEQINHVDTEGAIVWYVLSAWTESKEWCGAQFGLGDYDTDNFVIWEHGACFPSGGLTIPTSGWPGPNEGIALTTTDENWSGNFVPVYWFAGYVYGQDVIPLTLDPDSDFAGWARCVDHVEVAADSLGGLGLLTNGIYACPQEPQESSGGSVEDEVVLDGLDDYVEQELQGDDLESGNAVWIDLDNDDTDDGSPLEIELGASNSTEIVLEMTLKGFYAIPDTIDNKVYYHLGLEDEPRRAEVGEPELLYFPRSVLIPDDQRMVVSVTGDSAVDFADSPIAPSKGALVMGVDPDTVAYEFGLCYESDSLYPARSAELGRPYILRDYRGIIACFNAFQARPASDSLRVYTHMTIVIEPAGSDTVNVITRNGPPSELDADFATVYGRNFMNYESVRNGPVSLISEPLLIIVSDDGGCDFRTDVNPLVQWKRQCGRPTYVAPLSDILDPYIPDTTAIRQYIENMFCSAHISHVLLVGDIEQVPSCIAPVWYGDQTGPSDPRYTMVMGDDTCPDVFVGRFSASTHGQVQTQVERTITYERDLGIGEHENTTWLGHAFGLATNNLIDPPYTPPATNVTWMSARLGEWHASHPDVVGDTLHAYEHHQGDVSDGNAATLIGAFNDGGLGALLASVHGSASGWGEFPSFQNGAVYNLENYDRLPIVHAHSCDVGDFEEGTCFAEALMRARSPQDGAPIGAIATYMSSRKIRTEGPQMAQLGTVGILTLPAEVPRVSLGCALYGGVLDYIVWAGATGIPPAGARADYLTWTVFGDPSLSVRTAEAAPMTVTHSGYFHSQSEVYVVEVKDENGDPLWGAWAAVYADALNSGVPNGVICGAGDTGADGRVTIALDELPSQATSLKLTVTARNRVTYQGTIEQCAASVTETDAVTPARYELGPIWPTPARGAVRVRYSVGSDRGKGRVSLTIYDVAGRRVKRLVDGDLDPGAHVADWDGKDDAGSALPAGRYFCRMVAGDRALDQQLVILK
jgi:gingipain R